MNESPPADRPASWLLVIVCALFLLGNVLIPLTFGDVYPFTIAPMFEDAPRRCCNIRIYARDGKKLADNSTRHGDPITSPDPFLLRRYYDGNPVGLGVGIRPPKTLDEFGEVPDIAVLRAHVQAQLAKMPELDVVDVDREIIGPVDGRRVGIVETIRFRVTREDEEP